MLLSTSDFLTRPYRILNIEESKDFVDFVKTSERELLTDILGYSLWKELDETASPGAALIALRDGAEYEYVGKPYKYNGLVDLLKPAVMSLWIPKNNYKFTNVGYVESSPQENSSLVDPEQFRVQLWNEFVEKVGLCLNQKNSFYGFMKANESNYPEWDFTEQKAENRFGL